MNTCSLLIAVQSLSCVQLFSTLWTVAHHSPLSMGFSRQGYWSGLPVPSPGDLLNPGIEPASLVLPRLAGRSFTTKLPGQPFTYKMSIWEQVG